MRLSAEATVSDVEEALRLFSVSTLAASQANPLSLNNSSDSVKKAEDYLRRRMGLRTHINSKQIIEEASVQGYSHDIIKHAIAAMTLRCEVVEINQGKLLKRIK